MNNHLRVFQALDLLERWIKAGRKFSNTQTQMFKCRGLIEHDRWLTNRVVKK